MDFLVLNMEMNPQKVDVNVHPAKLEVRFEDENKVFKAVYHAIKDSLLKEDLIPDKTKIELDKQIQSNDAWKLGTNTFNSFANTSNSNNFGIKNTLETDINQYKVAEQNTTNAESIKPVSQFENKIETPAEPETVKLEETKSETSEETSRISNLDRFFNQDEEEKKEHKRGGLFGLFGRKKEQEIEEKKDENDTQNFIAQIYNNKNEINNYEDSANASDEITKSDNSTKIAENLETLKPLLENTKTNENSNTLETLNTTSENSAESVDATKRIDINEINEKMHKLDELKLDPDYKNFDEMYALTFGKPKKEEPKVEEKNAEYKINEADLKTAENISIFEKLPQNNVPDYKFIGIAFSTYIIIEMNSELYIIDQHAAHERIMYEKIKANYYNDTNKDSQLMLLPDIITLSHKDMQIAKDNMEIFEKAGFVLEEFGENTIKLSGVPTVCLDLDTKELFLETLDEINTVARTAKQEIEEKFIATVACKAAVKANMALTKEEVDSLMQELLTLPNPFTCPHGRPTAIRMTKADIEKKFSRR